LRIQNLIDCSIA